MLVRNIVFGMALAIFGSGIIETTVVQAQSTKKAKTKQSNKTDSKKNSAGKAEQAAEIAPANVPPLAPPANVQPKVPANISPTNDESTIIGKAKVVAKQSGMPLIVFGTADTCHRTAALREGLKMQPDLKLLMSQYVSTEIPFGGKEFAGAFREIVYTTQFKEPAIGSPSVFIFSADGKVLYAGPNSPNGFPPDEKLKELLISGIAQNGGLRGVASPATMVSDIEAAEALMASNQLPAAAAKMTKYASMSSVGNSDDLTQLAQLTGTTLPDVATTQRLSDLMQKLSQAGMAQINAAISPQADPVQSAMQLFEAQQAFEGYPGFTEKSEEAWKVLESTSQQENIKAQAELLVQAHQEEAKSSQAALKTYRKVIANYPSSKAEEYAQSRVVALTTRQWKNKSGKFSVTASLVKADNKSVQLLTEKGKTITVKVDDLSSDDQQYLSSIGK